MRTYMSIQYQWRVQLTYPSDYKTMWYWKQVGQFDSERISYKHKLIINTLIFLELKVTELV
jgi:hypothetical protein